MVGKLFARSTVTAEVPLPAVTVRLFAGAADVVGTRKLLLPVDRPLTVRDAFLRLCESFPDLRSMDGRLLFAANAEYAGNEFLLHADDELALIPPVSGGARL